MRKHYLNAALAAGASALALSAAHAAEFNIPSGDLATALDSYTKQSGVALLYPADAVRGTHTRGAKGELSADVALSRILTGTGFTIRRDPSGLVGIVKDAPAKQHSELAPVTTERLASADHAAASVETVVVTSSKIKGDIQTVPIAITALSQEQLTSRQIAGGPDLVKEVPNLTFSKTNFSGYNVQIRGIGTQAISVTTDPAVAVALNDIPFLRNHFFEQEFFDVNQVEVLRGPQGTLYGRNATAGVVNVITAKPTDQFEAMLSADWGNYTNRRYEGMVNIPIVDDRLGVRVAGEWTKRNGYTFDQSLGTNVDGRDLWSSRVTIGWKPVESVQLYAVWEHFQEDDDRMRSAKQLCEKDPGPTSVGGLDFNTTNLGGYSDNIVFARTWLSQGCLPTSMYSPNAYETPNGQTLPFVELGEFLFPLLNLIDPYANQTQPQNLRVIQSLILPHYRAKNDTLELNATYAVTPQLIFISQTGYNNDFLFSTEDFNRFDTAPGIFSEGLDLGINGRPSPVGSDDVYCDPQLGCSSSMVAADLSQERASQFNQEFRLASSFGGPLNFSIGANYTHYQTDENYYVFSNLLSAVTQFVNGSGPGQYGTCAGDAFPILPKPHKESYYGLPATSFVSVYGPFLGPRYAFGNVCTYIDPNPIDSLDGLGHNYFRSQNPYALNSYAGFGEVYYQVLPDLKLTGGLRWTDDRKIFTNIPSETFVLGGSYPIAGYVRQGWNQWTGRFVADWTPKLDFTDQSLIYASYAHGYKGGGANPPGPTTEFSSSQSFSTHPPIFGPEHIEAFELGTKNTALDGALTLDGDVFYYNYHGYQISQIVDRTSVNLNFNATVKGAELESSWEPLPGLKFNLAGGYEDSAVDKNQYAIDLMDRTAGNSNWVVVRPYPSETSNCILPATVVAAILRSDPFPSPVPSGLDDACDAAYVPNSGSAGVLGFAADDQAVFATVGFNPATAPNSGEGFAKNLSGNQLPNAPHFTTSLGADYTIPVSEDWAATLHGDFYWQSQSFARIFNDRPYDKIRGYSNVNLALILTSASGWQVMGYLKNVFDTTAITGTFLNSDDTALTTNVFVTDPRLFGVRVTRNW